MRGFFTVLALALCVISLVPVVGEHRTLLEGDRLCIMAGVVVALLAIAWREQK